MGREHIGYRCPVCCADMLTEADYKVGRRIQFVHSILMFFGLMKPADRNTVAAEGEELMRFQHHAGRTTVERL